MAATLQNGRIARFLMVIVLVVLTIFIYASYYSTTLLTVPPHMHSSSAAMMSGPLLSSNSNAVEASSSTFSRNLSSNLSSSADDSSANSSGANLNMIESKSVVLENVANSSALPAYAAEVSPPSGNNIQMIITNADKMLKSLTPPAAKATPINGSFASVKTAAQQSKSTSNSNNTNDPKSPVQSSSSSQSSMPLPPSTMMAANRGLSSRQSSPPASVVGTPVDPSNGIPTGKLYEYGHLDTAAQLCPDEGESIRLFIAITSAPTHYDARLAIRQTWGHYGTRRDVQIAFMLGRTTTLSIEDKLDEESFMYGDLIRGHFVDSYNNLTLKTISTLEWIDANCPRVDYVLKTDDDMFINVPKLLSFVEKHRNDKRTIFGRLAKKWKPIRNKKSKYYVSPGQFSASIFPPFTTGPAYLMTADIVHELYEKSLQQTYLKLEDVYTTGIVAQQLNIKRVHVNEFLNRRIAFNPCNIRKAISVHMIKSNEQFDLWKKLLDQTKCK